MRDAAETGERGTKPLVEMSLTALDPAKKIVLVLAGVSAGKTIFFKESVETNTTKVPIPSGEVSLTIVDGPFALKDITGIEPTLTFEPNRILPLLGMRDAGTSPAGGGTPEFLKKLQAGLGQVVTVKKAEPKFDLPNRKVTITLTLEVRAAGVKSDVTLVATLDLNTFEATLQTTGGALGINSKRIEERALGLTWVVEQAVADDLKINKEVEMFKLAFTGGETGLALNKKQARMEIRFDGLSSDGEGLVFDVEEFFVGRGGLDLVATVRDRPVRLNGLDVPFRFSSGRLEIRGSALTGAVIVGRGQLPPALVGDANCTIALAFGLDGGEIVVQSGKVDLDKKGEPIVCHSTRFTLTIAELDIGFARENGYHFYFLVTGSLRFTPKPGEFENGLLQHLEDVEISLERTPLSNDPRVLLRHISFQKALNPKKTFSLFNIFTFELRGFGFHPASPRFEGKPPAVNISGQIRFGETGDVMQPKIDFHELWIAPPKPGESLPRIKAQGLGVELQLAGAVKIRGAVLAVDPETRTVEGRQFAPDGFDTSGFLGEGALDIPGWGSMEASMGFLEVERREQPGERKKAFFLYLQKNKLAVEIPTPIWTFWLREAGFGFGYRYTLEGIKSAENAKSVAQLVKTLDDVSKRQGDLARFSAWSPDPEKDNFTLAMRAAFQPYPAEKTYNEKREQAAVSPFFFDIVAALRSDFTFLMSARGWLGVNYASFLANKDNFRERPTYRGYLYISAPRSELLLRGIADSKGFIGDDWPEVAKGQPLRRAVESVDWTTTLYIRPGLLHYEVGWPDQLAVRLVDEKNMRVVVRGGMIFRAAEDGLLFGYNIGAEAFIRFEGRAGGSIGVALVAELNARFVARVIAFLSSRFRGSLVYGLVSLDARLTFSVEAWMDVDLGFTSFTLRIGFSFSVQFTAAIELAISDEGMGGRVDARIAVQVFGCSLGVGIGFSFNDRQLDAARARVQRFLALSITADEPDAPAVFAAMTGDAAIDKNAQTAPAIHKAPETKPAALPVNGLKPPVNRSQFGRDIGPTNFHLVLRKAYVAPKGQPLPTNDEYAYGLFVPREATTEAEGGFYAAPATVTEKQGHQIKTAQAITGVKIWKPGKGKDAGDWVDFASEFHAAPRLTAPIEVPNGDEKTFTLSHFFDECFLADTKWNDPTTRVTLQWKEPKHVRIHELVEPDAVSPREREQLRDQQQKAHAAHAIEFPHDERAYQARATLLTMFLDQFVSLSATGDRTMVKVKDTPEAYVTDLGLVVFGKASELEKFADAEITKFDESHPKRGKVTIFNKRDTWFDRRDPVLANDHFAVEADGIKLGWRLSITGSDQPEFSLHHYELVRTIESAELTPCIIRVKRGATVGETRGNQVTLVPPDWQFIDTLDEESGVSVEMRRALLPTTGDVEGVAAAKAWLDVFKGDEEVTVTYSVTPVDTAGVRGLPRSFVVDVRRPRPPIRPAVGELRVVQTIAANAKGAQDSATKPADELQVFLALNDSAWSDDAKPTQTIGDIKYTVERIYRLIVDPDDLEPAGHYGSDGATSRLRGPGAWTPVNTGDERAIVIERAKTVHFTDKKVNDIIREIEPQEDELKKLPRWAKLSDEKFGGAKVFETAGEKNEFLNLLWKRDDGSARVATRFFLETLIRFTPPNGGTPIEHVSKRVAVPVEHVIVGPARATLRPDALEWAVPLELPPLGEGQVRAESGFARFRIPKAGARLDDLGKKNQQLGVARDPERRVLTSVSFAAVPDWAGGSAAQQPLHASTIAGFDLYELDLDELAPFDVDPKEKSLASNVDAWKRARRVARIEQLSKEAARLVPEGNTDWQGWQAHYPSGTQRLELGSDPKPGRESKPILAAWYSDHESTPHFAERRPRLRLLPLPPETAVAELMRGGAPKRIFASLVAAADTAAQATHARINAGTNDPPPIGLQLPDIVLHAVRVGDQPLDGFERPVRDPKTKEWSIRKTSGQYSAKDVRNLLLRLGWKAFAEDDKYARAWLDDPGALDGLTLVLRAEGDFARHLGPTDATAVAQGTGRVEIPLELRSPLHPILEEVVAELALHTREDQSAVAVYRRYTVMPQPVTASSAKDFAGFMASTAAEADPYGWRALQLLGEATTIRVYDCAVEAFLKPSELREHVDRVFHTVLTRWRDAYGKPFARIAGQPFAEVFLRPGADRLPGPFDAVIDKREEEEPPPLELDDDGLSFVQLSLRPRPAGVRAYKKQTFFWRKALPGDNGTIRALYVSIARVESRELHVARADGGPILEQPGTIEKILVPIPRPDRFTELTNDDKEVHLTLFFRVEAAHSAAGARPPLAFVIEREIDGVRVKQEIPFAAGSPLGLAPEWKDVPAPAVETPDPFARFESIQAERWTGIFTNDAAAVPAFQALREVTRAAGFAFPEPAAYDQIVGGYLSWAQRFLDHCAQQADSDPNVVRPLLALAAPIKATPWRLAPDAEGSIQLTFLHSDRWGHARAYAVKPLGRYHALLAGIGVEAEQRAETFSLAAGTEAGFAVAVSQRTEKIEPPVILTARLMGPGRKLADPEQEFTEIVIARHGEESLSSSNRPLLARLGVPASLIAFSRAYRFPAWPDRLKQAFEKPAEAPSADVLPARKAMVPTRPADTHPQITRDTVGSLAHEYPSLWKGADIWHLSPLPPHYRLIALASERAGIIVSDIATVVQEDQPRAQLEKKKDVLENKAQLQLVRDKDDKTVRLVIKHPLISHETLTPTAAGKWLGHGEFADVALWPDPDVLYVVSRRFTKDKGTTFITEQEDAEVRLVTTAEGETAGEDPRPVIVRARGPLYAAAPKKGDATRQDILVTSTRNEAEKKRAFDLRFTLQFQSKQQQVERIRLRDEGPEWGTDAQMKAFNDAAVSFAAILTSRKLEIDLAPASDTETGTEYLVRLEAVRKAAAEAIGKPPFDTLANERWNDGRLTDELRRWTTALDEWIKGDGKTLADSGVLAGKVRAAAKLPFKLEFSWKRGVGVPPLGAGETVSEDLTKEPGVILAVWDHAANEEIDQVQASGAPVANLDKGRLYDVLAKKILGAANGFWLRAVDGRARMTFNDKGEPAGASGVIDGVPIRLPDGLEQAKERIVQ
jgi:hypothetical protein